MGKFILQVDKNNRPIKLRPRKDFHKGDLCYRSAHLLLFNSEGQLLLQKRSKDKDWDPNRYSYSVSGTVEKESYRKCIIREAKEEIGLEVSVEKLFEYKSVKPTNQAFRRVFIAYSDKEIKINKKEIQFVKWVSLDKLKEDITKNPKKYTLAFLEGMRKYFKNFG